MTAGEFEVVALGDEAVKLRNGTGFDDGLGVLLVDPLRCSNTDNDAVRAVASLHCFGPPD